MNPQKLAAIVWMMLDSRTPDGEAQNALAALRRMAPSQDEVRAALGGGGAPVKTIVLERTPEFSDPVLPWGKHRGKRLSLMAREHPSYLQWLLDEWAKEAKEPGKVGRNEYMAQQIHLAFLQAKESK